MLSFPYFPESTLFSKDRWLIIHTPCKNLYELGLAAVLIRLISSVITSINNFSTPKDSHLFDLVTIWGRKNLGCSSKYFLVQFTSRRVPQLKNHWIFRTTRFSELFKTSSSTAASWQNSRWIELSGLMIYFAFGALVRFPFIKAHNVIQKIGWVILITSVFAFMASPLLYPILIPDKCPQGGKLSHSWLT